MAPRTSNFWIFCAQDIEPPPALVRRSFMDRRKLKPLGFAELAVGVLFIFVFFAFCEPHTMSAELAFVLLYVPILLVWPLVVCPILGVHLRDEEGVTRKESVVFPLLVFLRGCILFAIPALPLLFRRPAPLLALLIFLPAAVGALAFGVGLWVRRRIFTLEIFFIYAAVLALLWLPRHLYAMSENRDLLLVHMVVLYFPLLILTPLVACPVLGRITQMRYAVTEAKDAAKYTGIVFVTLLAVCGLSVEPSVFSRLLWTDYRMSLLLCVLLPALVGALTFGLTVAPPRQN